MKILILLILSTTIWILSIEVKIIIQHYKIKDLETRILNLETNTVPAK